MLNKNVSNKLNRWRSIARESQRAPKEPWKIWLLMAGRAFGKTFTGANTILQWIAEERYKNICFISKTFDDVDKTMVSGPSGIVPVSESWGIEELMPKYQKSKKTLLWPNGAKISIHSADAAESLRGPQFDCIWIDELAKFENAEYVFDQLQFCLRLGNDPKILITTTPKPTNFIKKLVSRNDIKVTRGSTFENSENLPMSYIASIRETYENTMLGRQEIYGEIIDNSLWSQSMFKKCDMNLEDVGNNLSKIVISIDPAVTSNQNSNETGIIVAGCKNNNFYIIDDMSGKYSPTEWAKVAIDAYHYYKADKIIAEINNGGDIVESILRSVNGDIRYESVYASKGKFARAEPIISLYEQGKVFHNKNLQVLEKHMTTCEKEALSDRIDALVWSITYLSNHKSSIFFDVMTY